MNFLNLNNKILIGMLLMMISIVIMGFIALYTSHAINNKTVEVINKYTQSVELIYNIRHLTEEVVLINLKKHDEENAIFARKEEQKLEDIQQELKQSFQKFLKVHDNDSNSLYQDSYSDWKEYMSILEKESTDIQNAGSVNTKSRKAREQYEKVRLSLNKLLDIEKKALEKLKEEQKSAYGTANKTIWGALFLFLFLGTTLTLYLKTIIKLNKQHEEKIKYLAYHDSLTGLPNRSLFNETLHSSIVKAEKESRKLGIMFIDVDRFKHVNDTLGHKKGDVLINQVAQRLSQCIGNKGLVSRRGGDEFTILFSCANKTEIKEMANMILHTFKEPFQLQSSKLHVTSSIGISVYPENGTDPDTLLRVADVAMYEAKKSGKNRFCFLSADEQSKMKKSSQLEIDLYYAVENGFDQFQLYYQPKVNIADGEITGAEALIRWNHPDFGLVAPNDFLPIAEETGLIVPIGEWVIRQACFQNKLVHQLHSKPIRTGINLSVVQFFQPNLISTVKQIIAETGVNPAYLEFEITESIAMSDFNMIAGRLEELKDLGVTIAMDDFGTGYSSLSYLKKLPIDTLKIDQSFIKDVKLNKHDRTLVKTIIQMAKGLNLHVVAEGVEEATHVHLLQEENCDEAQGYYYSRPLNEIEFFQLINKNVPSRSLHYCV